jgi:uncharacterized protein YigA (DUF484 family)
VAIAEDAVVEEHVADYLRRNPDFFTRHEPLLAQLKVPHARGKAVSLVEKQITVLRDENQHLQRKLDTLIEAAKRNEKLNQRIHRLIVTLLASRESVEFFDLLYSTLTAEFQTDAVVLRYFSLPAGELAQRAEFIEYDAQVFTLFDTVLGRNQPLCGRLSAAQVEYLFGEAKIGSAVLVPLGIPEPQGILALGSADVARFHSGMGTDLLKYLGETVSQLLKRWL